VWVSWRAGSAEWGGMECKHGQAGGRLGGGQLDGQMGKGVGAADGWLHAWECRQVRRWHWDGQDWAVNLRGDQVGGQVAGEVGAQQGAESPGTLAGKLANGWAGHRNVGGTSRASLGKQKREDPRCMAWVHNRRTHTETRTHRHVHTHTDTTDVSLCACVCVFPLHPPMRKH
jgi:hypothetical protein